MAVCGSGPLIALAGGGTGGHLYPMLSVVREIGRRTPGAKFVFFTTRRAIDERVIRCAMVDDASYEIVEQSVLPLPGSIRDAYRFLGAWRASTRLCRQRFCDDRPTVVLGSGGYGSGPPIHVARRMGIRTALLNPDAIPGRANRYLASRADVVFAQWSVVGSHLSRRANVQIVGCPIRESFAEANRSSGVRRFGLDPSGKTLLVTGASQGARTINRAMCAIGDAIAKIEGWQVLHLAGDAEAEAVREAYGRQGVRATVLEYTEHMADALAAADLILSRAGASTLAEITAVGRASVLMPYPFDKNRHQTANALVLGDAGAAVVVEDRMEPARNGAALREVLMRLMCDEAVLSRMARCAAELGRFDAASKIAEELLAPPVATRESRFMSRAGMRSIVDSTRQDGPLPSRSRSGRVEGRGSVKSGV